MLRRMEQQISTVMIQWYNTCNSHICWSNRVSGLVGQAQETLQNMQPIAASGSKFLNICTVSWKRKLIL